jgi:hypothetical protein
MTRQAYAVGKKSRGVDMRGAYLAKIEEKKVRWRGNFRRKAPNVDVQQNKERALDRVTTVSMGSRGIFDI